MVDDEIRFIENRDKIVIPTMRLLHKYPFMMKHMQCDKGAIKHILSGSDVMCPGLTSAGGKMDDSIQRGDVVAITAEGKVHAMGIGIATMSPKEIREKNKDVAIELVMNLNDGIWKLTRPSVAAAE